MRSIKKLILGALASIMISTSAMADYTFVIPQKPGGGTSVWAEIIAGQLEPFLGEKIILKHIPGARDIPGFNEWHNNLRDEDKVVMVSHGGNGVAFLQEKVDKQLHHWIHFSLTSEDVNNLAYSMMWRDGLKKVYLPYLTKVNNRLFELSEEYKCDSLLSLTHGQPATPTTFGKELLVFHSRLQRQIDQIKNHHLLGKFGGATGTWSAHLAAYPNTDWIAFAKKFISSLGLVPNLVTTQIEPHDSISESFHHIVRINSILIDLCKDIWFYISRGILGQKRVKGEVGSSTMPHKINPIQFENAEGNLGISNCLLNHFTAKLPVSRMQRDLSDSTVIRNQGVALGHSYLALNNILKGLLRISLNKQHILKELNSHWEVLGEAIQTVLRKANTPNAYEQLKELTRGQTISQVSVISFIKNLNISEKDKESLLKLTPENYVGLAPKLIESL